MEEVERKAVVEMLKRRAARRANTRGNARQWLIEEGFNGGDGKLSPQYGGSVPDEQPER